MLMRSFGLAALATLALSSCSKYSPKPLSVAEVAEGLAKGTLHAFDANGPKFRLENGIVPNATLLTSSSEYDLKILPADKAAPLVFYCANTLCRASHGAAERAMEAGWTNVGVMGDGLKGWKAAGQPVAKTEGTGPTPN